MTNYDFTLIFKLLDDNMDPAQFIDVLYEAGCDDALLGVGSHGKIALNFTRQAESKSQAISSAISDVMSAMPSAVIVEQ